MEASWSVWFAGRLTFGSFSRFLEAALAGEDLQAVEFVDGIHVAVPSAGDLQTIQEGLK